MRCKILVALLMSVVALTAKAQTDPIYLREIGGGIGLTGYLGDFNSSLTKSLQPAATLLYRRNLSPWYGLKVDATYSQLKGSYKDESTFYPEYDKEFSFKRSMADLNISFEYNFWPYGTGNDYRGAQRVTPFIFLGLGATAAFGEGKTTVTANVPIGVGVKYKVADRVNLGVEWGMHFSLSDKLDGIVDPYAVKSSGIFKNTDCYSSLRLTLTYSFSAKCPTCNKDDW